METNTIPNTGLVQTPMKEQSPCNTAHILNKGLNLIASVSGVDLKTKCFVNQDLWWEECTSTYTCCDIEAQFSVKAAMFC